jgi:transketolase
MAKVETWEFGDVLAKASSREAFPRKILELAGKNENVYFIDVDGAPEGSIQDQFRKTYPDRFVEVGIAEPNAVGIASGLGLSGKIPFLCAFGPFLSIRTTEQIFLDIAYNDVPAKLVGTHSGLTSGGGPTHCAIIDMAVLRSMPNMTVVSPTDARQLERLLDASIDYPYPMFIRVARGEEPLVYKDQNYEYQIGKSILTRDGTDATVIGCGIGVFMGLQAAYMLEKDGISVRVIDMHTIKPLDKEAVIKAATETKAIVTVEDHNIIGGLGSAVAETLAEASCGVKFKRLGVPDCFAVLGTPEDLYKHYGYDSTGIAKTLKDLLDK